jgi:hypothetical protein
MVIEKLKEENPFLPKCAPLDLFDVGLYQKGVPLPLHSSTKTPTLPKP